jgi:hypothetical protein
MKKSDFPKSRHVLSAGPQRPLLSSAQLLLCKCDWVCVCPCLYSPCPNLSHGDPALSAWDKFPFLCVAAIVISTKVYMYDSVSIKMYKNKEAELNGLNFLLSFGGFIQN